MQPTWAHLLYRGEAMNSPYVQEMLSSVSESNSGYGLGVSISETQLGRSCGHAGQFPGYRSAIAYFPDHDLAVAVQVNTDAGVDTGRCPGRRTGFGAIVGCLCLAV